MSIYNPELYLPFVHYLKYFKVKGGFEQLILNKRQ
jgi:hypothetical protein